jgi:hypothetical protein
MDSDRPIVSNTTPLIALVEVGLLDLLPTLYGTLLIPDAVYQEYQVRVAAGRPSLGTFAWIRTVQTVAQADLSTALDTGEASAITLAIQVNARALLIDEKRGRRIAQRHGLTIIGTMGILVAAKHRNLIPSVASVLDMMISQGRYISPSLRAQVLQAVDEDDA